MLTETGTRISHVGDPVEARLIAPVVQNGETVLPAGLVIRGQVARVVRLGMGMKNLTAEIQYFFHTLYLPDGTPHPISTRLTLVDTAKEQVDPQGRILGIRPTTNVSSSLSFYAWRLVWLEPVVAAPVWAVKFLFAKSPDPEIYFPTGTEFLLQLEDKVSFVPPPPSADRIVGLPAGDAEKVRNALARIPNHRAIDKNGKPTDYINVVLVGSEEQVTTAFSAAGWVGADKRSFRSLFRTFRAVTQRIGYKKAPVNNLLLDGAPPSMVYQKSLNTFAKRHHGRVWKNSTSLDNGQKLWTMAATEDVSIRFKLAKFRWVHSVDPRVDNERTKVISDLMYTECVEFASLLDRSQLIEGDAHLTDGKVAVVKLKECKNPRTLGMIAGRNEPWVKRAWVSFSQDLFRSNLLFLGYNTTKLVAYTKDYLTPNKSHSPRGESLSKQQTDLLANNAPPAESPTRAPVITILDRD